LKRVSIQISIFVCLVMLINFTGCGIKGNPVIISRVPDYRQNVKNFTAVSSGDELILKWDFCDKDFKINYVVIEKSEVGSAGNECKDCPRTFERAGEVPVKEAGRKNKECNSFSFTDKKVIHEKTYDYRLMLCDDSNICYKSESTEINFK
jgi:hypothetical protein